MAETDSPPLLILAMDHRDSLEKQLYGLTAAPTAAEAATIAADKVLVYQGLLDAIGGLPGCTPGVLVDEQYGASVAELAATEGSVDLAMPLEASGHPFFAFAYPDDWQRHAEFFGIQQAKVLVRDNPGFDEADRAEQARHLATVSAWASGRGMPLLLELLVPATEGDKAAVGDDTDRYDREVRPRLTVQVMRYLQEQGVEPAIWKIEGLDTTEAAEQVVAAARREGRTARCIVLGRHAPADRLDTWLRIAAPVDGFTGFAIGRSIWWDALGSHRAGHLDDAGVRAAVAKEYGSFARTYLDAAAKSGPGSV